MNLLLVEEQPHLRFLYRMEFELDGYRVWEAASAGEALEVLAQRKIDGVVTELSLPDMNGLLLINEVLSTHRHLPIIINTAYPRFRDDFHCWGADAFLTKNSDLTALKNAVVHYVGPPKLQTQKLRHA